MREVVMGGFGCGGIWGFGGIGESWDFGSGGLKDGSKVFGSFRISSGQIISGAFLSGSRGSSFSATLGIVIPRNSIFFSTLGMAGAGARTGMEAGGFLTTSFSATMCLNGFSFLSSRIKIAAAAPKDKSKTRYLKEVTANAGISAPKSFETKP